MGHMRDHGSCNAGRHKAGTEVLQRGCHQLEGRSQRSKRCGNSQGCSKVDGLCTPFLNGRPAQRPWGHALPSPAQPRPGSSRRLRPRPWPSTCSRDHATGMQRGRLSSARPAGSVPGLVDFEDKEQVKAFLENVVECKYQCYCEKDPNGLYELLAVLPVQLGPRVDSQEDLTFLWDMFGEKSLHSLIHEKLHYYEKQNPVPILHGAAVLADDLAEELQNKPLNSEIRELLKLLSKPNVKALLSVHDTVAQKNYDPVLPPMPDDIDDEEDSVKIIRLVKNREPLGATIKKDEQTGAIVVARIMRGGAADRSGLIHVGDELREVNGIPVEDKRPEEIIQILAQSQGAITFKIIPSIKEETPSKEGKMFIKALFDYNPNEDKAIPCKEAGLSFKKGDILQIMSQDDATWWQAKHAGDANPRAGLIPSKHFQERRLALRRPEILVQPFKVSSRKSSGFRRSFRLSRKDKKTNKSMYECKKSDQYDTADVPTYEEVTPYRRQTNEKYRLVVLVGPVGVGLNELKRKLLISDTQHYGVTVPHTTRAKRSQESDGVEYIFISKHLFETDVQNNKFIEYGEYKNNYYGTSIDSVRSVLAKNKVCLLDVQPHTVKHLRTLEFKPYVIFIKPPSIERLRETRKNAKIISSRDDQGAAKPFTEEDFQDMIKSAQIMENQYGHLFDKIIVNDDLTVAFNELKTTFDKLETEAHWVPVSWLHS
ncbi:MAGUK p55 subfamily member 7 isoform X11 [Canis lupus familiaris]|uniref:MAGUK p55 subfamily member 7 isoform X11 n=1 Tax=Canis lupus familiaris TaxID=9615 RepID=UPI0018F6E1A5|nr:MAGUK p55 subfamily member 7 isoform X11 [Canis lupus familiaris]